MNYVATKLEKKTVGYIVSWKENFPYWLVIVLSQHLIRNFSYSF